MTADDVIDQIEAILAHPRGRGDLQAPVWYSKLRAIEAVIADYRQEQP